MTALAHLFAKVCLVTSLCCCEIKTEKIKIAGNMTFRALAGNFLSLFCRYVVVMHIISELLVSV